MIISSVILLFTATMNKLVLLLVCCIFILSEYVTSYLFPRLFFKNIRLLSNSKISSNNIADIASTEQIINGLSVHPIQFSDEEEEEEEEAVPATTDAPDESTSGMSLIKEGVNFSTPLNGSDVRVGIIATKWNADVISGLYKVSV